uniref:EGF-like domain-containing protein n=3 Tax=Magallana gigas TaxID=29159 RepID=A0A8W8JQE5_MAGGI
MCVAGVDTTIFKAHSVRAASVSKAKGNFVSVDDILTKDIGGAMVLNDQVVITDTVSCPAGYMVIGDNCVACSMGTFYNSTSQNCEICPVGTYGSSTGLTDCTICGSGKTTLGVGYTASGECVGGCLIGNYWDGSKCALCPKHYYQNMTGKDYCFSCPLGKKTSGMGSNSSSQCFDDCSEGTELKPDGKCVECLRGYYRSFLEDVCMECPAGNTTAGNGSTSKDSCDMTICYNGTYRNKTANVCESCPVGEYQPEDLQEECIKCPTKYSTESAGKNNITDCKFYCPKGYEILSAANETCLPCSRGFYKDNSDLFGSCVSCPTGNTTEKMNSTSIESCSISECSSGQEIDSTGECYDCDLNKYQPVNIPTSTDKCLSCKDNYGTKQKMSNISSDCLPMCLGGHFFNQTSMMCEKCPRGSWNNGNFTMKFEDCVACPVNFTTTGPGMTSEDNCTLLDCDPGSYISGTDCLMCDYGYYQTARHQGSCIKCGDNLNTSIEGASKQEECQLYCGAGFEGQTGCTACKEGFVKGGSGTFMCQECTGNLTSNDARTECTELFCDKGFYSNAHQNSCMPCDIGYFKKDRGNALKCTGCPDGFLTPNIASTSAENCNEPFCIPGHYLNSSDVCVPCLIGFYKDVTGNGNCTACPSNLTTPLISSTELSNCSIVVCDAGEKRISSNNTCMKCPLGYYQPKRGENDCIKCGDGQTTEQVGTDTMTGCIPICPAGEEYVSTSKTCKECLLGSYKSEIGNNKACTRCPGGYTTEFTGSISVSNCSLPDCLPGTYRSAGGCQNCTVGTYQDLNSQESCKPCPSVKNTTETTGAKSESYCIKFCLPGQQYDRTTATCQNCPKDFYTNKTISQYCIKCPDGYITYGEGSDTCVKLSIPDSGTTQAPAEPVQQTYSFNLKYKAEVDCDNFGSIRNQIKANILGKIRGHLRNLVKRFAKLCSLPVISKCFASIEVKIKNCNTATTRKRSTAPSFIDVELNIPDLGETVTDSSKDVELQTEAVLQEDLDTQKAEYTPEGFTLDGSSFVGKYVTCTVGYISTNNNQSCEKCLAGTYHDSTSNQCLNCTHNSYQEEDGQSTCINCPESINKYTLFTGSRSKSDCVSECKKNPNYCKNEGKCYSNEVTIWCTCKERFSGPKCEDQAELTSNTPYIIGGAVGGFALLMIIALVVISIVRCLKGSRDSSASKYSQKDDLDYNGYNYNVPLQMYDNNSKRGRMPDSYARMNPAFGYDDQFGDTYPRGPYREDNNAYRWQEANGDYDL